MLRLFVVMMVCFSFYPVSVMGQMDKEPKMREKKTLDAKQERKVIKIGQRIVDRVGEASAYLTLRGDLNGALIAITKALVDISKLQKMSLAFKQTREITAEKGLIKNGNASLASGIIPLYEDVNLWSVDGERYHSKNMAPSPVVTAVAWEEIRRTLDLQVAEKKLKQVVRILRTHRFRDAVEVLHSFYGEAVVYEVDATSWPLYRVAQNLMLAKVALEDRNDKDTQAALKEAVVALKEYEKIASGDLKDEAMYLRKIIDVRVDVISNEPDRGAALVQGWWEKVIDWTQES